MINEMKTVTQNKLQCQELMFHKGVFPLKRGTRPLVDKSMCRKKQFRDTRFSFCRENGERRFRIYLTIIHLSDIHIQYKPNDLQPYNSRKYIYVHRINDLFSLQNCFYSFITYFMYIFTLLFFGR